MNRLKNFKDYLWWLLYSNRQKIIRKLLFPDSFYHKRIKNIFEVKTNRIRYLAGGEPQRMYKLRRTDMDLVLGGDWDFYGNYVEEDLFYIAAKQHFFEKKPWTTTAFVQNQLEHKSKIELLKYLKDKNLIKLIHLLNQTHGVFFLVVKIFSKVELLLNVIHSQVLMNYLLNNEIKLSKIKIGIKKPRCLN